MKIGKGLVVPIVLVLIVSVMSVTLAYFALGITETGANAAGVVTGSLNVSLSDTAVNVTGIKPIYSTKVDSQAYKKDFVISNPSSSLNACNKVYLNVTSISNALKSAYFKYKIVIDGTTKTGNFSAASNGSKMLLFDKLYTATNTSKNGSLYIWVEYAESVDQFNMLGTTLSANLVLESIDSKTSSICSAS